LNTVRAQPIQKRHGRQGAKLYLSRIGVAVPSAERRVRIPGMHDQFGDADRERVDEAEEVIEEVW
jgi:hypothetical protein